MKLVLALGVHDSGYVDAYHGPAEWKTAVAAGKLPLDEIRKRELAARAALARIRIAGAEEMLRLRHAFLDQQLASMKVRLDLLDGHQAPFDTESRLLYGAVAPRVSNAETDAIVSELEHALPGAGSLSARLSAFRQEYVVSVERLPAVMKAVSTLRFATALQNYAAPLRPQFLISNFQFSIPPPAPPPDQWSFTNRTHTGCPTFNVCPVGLRSPDFASTEKIRIESEPWFSAQRYLPEGSKLKFRGVRPPVDTLEIQVRPPWPS